VSKRRASFETHRMKFRCCAKHRCYLLSIFPFIFISVLLQALYLCPSRVFVVVDSVFVFVSSLFFFVFFICSVVSCALRASAVFDEPLAILQQFLIFCPQLSGKRERLLSIYCRFTTSFAVNSSIFFSHHCATEQCKARMNITGLVENLDVFFFIPRVK